MRLLVVLLFSLCVLSLIEGSRERKRTRNRKEQKHKNINTSKSSYGILKERKLFNNDIESDITHSTGNAKKQARIERKVNRKFNRKRARKARREETRGESLDELVDKLPDADSLDQLTKYVSRKFAKEWTRTVDDIDDVTTEIVNLQRDFRDATESERESYKHVDQLEQQIDAMIDDGAAQCGPREVWCGFPSKQCVSELSICDGVQDCVVGGRDERYCDVPLPLGSVWVAGIVFDHCQGMSPRGVAMTVKQINVNPWFPMRPEVHVEFNMDFSSPYAEIRFKNPTQGTYDYATNNLVFPPMRDDRLSMRCHFDRIQDNYTLCDVVREASRGVCARVIYTRIE